MPGGTRRSRRPGRDAHGLGEVALLSASRAHAGRPGGGRLAAGRADAGPGRRPAGAGARLGRGRSERPARRVGQRGRDRRRCARRAAAAVRSAGALLGARVPRRACGRTDRAVRGRRGALRVPVGPRLSARLLPAGRRRAGARRARDSRVHGHGHPAGGGGRRSAARVEGAAACGDGVRPPEPRVCRGAAGAAREAQAAGRGAASRRRAACDRLRGHPSGLGGPGRDAHRRSGRAGAALPRGARSRAARGGAAAVPAR